MSTTAQQRRFYDERLARVERVREYLVGLGASELVAAHFASELECLSRHQMRDDEVAEPQAWPAGMDDLWRSRHGWMELRAVGLMLLAGRMERRMAV